MAETTPQVIGWRTSDPPKVNVNVGLLIVSGSFHGEAYYGADDDGRDECWRWASGSKVYGEVDLWMPMPTREDAGMMAALYVALKDLHDAADAGTGEDLGPALAAARDALWLARGEA